MVKQNNWEKLLSKVQPQKAPHFLFTRIESKLEVQKKMYFSPAVSKVLAACVIGLLAVNILLITKLLKSSSENQSIVISMGMSSSENIYDQP